ncbi:hypothetical protein FQA47_006241 [Oryzias melastigma]|uniref:Uncharacterized protein n=1 Tax=Oryzias melastigma TaxID=30732 RepID=A0A834FKL7_ORYME|nr:hypothetical protein FQA47_006241 [Oryzias melastigma]
MHAGKLHVCKSNEGDDHHFLQQTGQKPGAQRSARLMHGSSPVLLSLWGVRSVLHRHRARAPPLESDSA